MNTGPPRLRIDNVLNLRLGTSMDDDFEERKGIPPPKTIPPADIEQAPRTPSENGMNGDSVNKPEGRDMMFGAYGDRHQEGDDVSRHDHDLESKQQQ